VTEELVVGVISSLVKEEETILEAIWLSVQISLLKDSREVVRWTLKINKTPQP